jgi:hypothetical protein
MKNFAAGPNRRIVLITSQEPNTPCKHVRHALSWPVTRTPKFKVLRAIIGHKAVSVMNCLAFFQGTTENLSHHKAMLKNLTATSGAQTAMIGYDSSALLVDVSLPLFTNGQCGVFSMFRSFIVGPAIALCPMRLIAAWRVTSSLPFAFQGIAVFHKMIIVLIAISTCHCKPLALFDGARAIPLVSFKSHFASFRKKVA